MLSIFFLLEFPRLVLLDKTFLILKSSCITTVRNIVGLNVELPRYSSKFLLILNTARTILNIYFYGFPG